MHDLGVLSSFEIRGNLIKLGKILLPSDTCYLSNQCRKEDFTDIRGTCLTSAHYMNLVPIRCYWLKLLINNKPTPAIKQ